MYQSGEPVFGEPHPFLGRKADAADETADPIRTDGVVSMLVRRKLVMFRM